MDRRMILVMTMAAMSGVGVIGAEGEEKEVRPVWERVGRRRRWYCGCR